jgi:coenzyme F420-reducing hydrogenase delta subunit
MNTIKSTLVLKEHYPDINIKVFYIDIRAFGKGFEDLYMRSRRSGVNYLRGLPGTVEELPDRSLRVAVENTASAGLEFHDLDMLVSGCHIGDCHYIDANHWTQKRVRKLQKRMEKLGIKPDRLQLEWISATEGVRFAGVMNKMEKIRQEISSQEIADTIKILNRRKKQVLLSD